MGAAVRSCDPLATRLKFKKLQRQSFPDLSQQQNQTEMDERLLLIFIDPVLREDLCAALWFHVLPQTPPGCYAVNRAFTLLAFLKSSEL